MIEKYGLVANNTKDVGLKSPVHHSEAVAHKSNYKFLIIYNKDLLSCRDIQ